MKGNNIAVLLIGGKGERLGGDLPKQFKKIDGKPLFFFALEALESSPYISSILIVANKQYMDLTKTLVKGKNKILSVIEGGETRAESSKNAIDYISKSKLDGDPMILICDGDRPNLIDRYISESIEKASICGASIVGVKARDSMAMSANGKLDSYLNRDNVIKAQTPQTFKLSILLKAYEKEKNISSFTDEGSLVLSALGISPSLIIGAESNIKITTVEDFNNFERSESWKRK